MIRLLNISLRVISMASRFILFTVIAKLLAPAELGLLGLLIAGIGFFVLLVGADYYTFSNREILSSSKNEYAKIISNQIYAYLPMYAISIPIVLLAFNYDLLPWEYFYLFLLLTIVEHVSQEQNRLLNVLNKQLSASILLFIRSASWVLIVLPLMYFNDALKSIDILLMFWLGGSLLAVITGIYLTKKEIDNFTFYPPDYSWIKKGYKVGFTFLLGTIAFKALATIDRFWLERVTDTATVGVYVFYFSLLIGVTALIHAGLIVFSTPAIIRSYQEKDYLKFNILLKKFLKELILSIIIIMPVMLILTPYVIDWINRPEYMKDYNVFYILMLTAITMVISNHPQTYLYASRHDKYILYSNISSLAVFLLALLMFHNFTNELKGIYQVSISVFLSYLWLTTIKYFGYYHYNTIFIQASKKENHK